MTDASENYKCVYLLDQPLGEDEPYVGIHVYKKLFLPKNILCLHYELYERRKCFETHEFRR